MEIRLDVTLCWCPGFVYCWIIYMKSRQANSQTRKALNRSHKDMILSPSCLGWLNLMDTRPTLVHGFLDQIDLFFRTTRKMWEKFKVAGNWTKLSKETKTLIVKDILKVEHLWYMDQVRGIITQHVNIKIGLIPFDQIQIKLNNKIAMLYSRYYMCRIVLSSTCNTNWKISNGHKWLFKVAKNNIWIK